jgi:phosphoserine phosphatase
MPDRAGPVYILDLDGTVLGINSFPRWVLYLVIAPLPCMRRTRRLALAGRVTALLVRRKLGLIDHDRFKWRLQRLWDAFPDADADGFAERMLRHVRPELRSALAAIGAGQVDAVLATAAPADYAHRLGTIMGFRHVLATQAGRDASEAGNDGDRKRIAVESLLARQGWRERERIVFTDHVDDMPLISICHRAYWFGTEDGMRTVARTCPAASVQRYDADSGALEIVTTA